MIHLEAREEYSQAMDQAQLKRAAKETLKHAGIPLNSDLTVVITGDDHLQRLNNQFTGVDAPTDVLSFPAGDIDPDTGEPYLGDILISYPRATAQAEIRNHSTDTELQLLVVHGVLHLLGYDHANQSEKEDMWRAQAEILSKLGVLVDNYSVDE